MILVFLALAAPSICHIHNHVVGRVNLVVWRIGGRQLTGTSPQCVTEELLAQLLESDDLVAH